MSEVDELKYAFQRFHDYVERANACTVDIDETEFQHVLETTAKHYQRTPVFNTHREHNLGRLPDKTEQECLRHATEFMVDQYQCGKENFQIFLNASEHGTLDWSTIRRFVASRDIASVWCSLLRMTHLSGDFGRDVARARLQEMEMRRSLERATTIIPTDAGFTKMLEAWNEDPLQEKKR